MAVFETIAGAIAVAKTAYEAADAVIGWAERSVILEINNMTAETLDFLDDYVLHSGTLEPPIPDKIKPFDSVLFTAATASIGEGAVGDLHFRGRDMVLLLDYSNPVLGGNDLDATVAGARAGEFRFETSAGPGHKSARFRCAIWQDWQDGWRFCPKCRGLFGEGDGNGVCPAGGPHDPVGWNYILVHGAPEGPNLQATWRFCPKCRGLFGEGNGNGSCPAGGPHDPVGWQYCVPHDLAPGNHLQPDWRFCPKCRGLFGEGNSNGKCPVGGPHDPLGWAYLMVFATPQP